MCYELGEYEYVMGPGAVSRICNECVMTLRTLSRICNECKMRKTLVLVEYVMGFSKNLIAPSLAEYTFNILSTAP